MNNAGPILALTAGMLAGGCDGLSTKSENEACSPIIESYEQIVHQRLPEAFTCDTQGNLVGAGTMKLWDFDDMLVAAKEQSDGDCQDVLDLERTRIKTMLGRMGCNVITGEPEEELGWTRYHGGQIFNAACGVHC